MFKRHAQVALLALVMILASLFGGGSFAQALSVPPKPSAGPVVDQTGTLSPDQVSQLSADIAQERAATGNQIAVLMIESLENDALEDYSLKVAREWGVGQEERNSGVLLLVVKSDKKLRIEVGYGLEGALTDIRSSQIIRDRIRPFFVKNDYFGGLQSGVAGIITAIHGEVDPNLTTPTDTQGQTSFPWEIILFFGLFGFSWLGSILARTKSWWAGGVIGAIIGSGIVIFAGLSLLTILGASLLAALGLIFDKSVSKNYQSHARRGDAPSWWAGGPFIGGGGGSGGGFGGFGGGGFGGGGASGDW